MVLNSGLARLDTIGVATSWREGRHEDSAHQRCTRRIWAKRQSLQLVASGSWTGLRARRGQGDLGRFSGVKELGVLCFQIRIETSGDERWHIESLAQAGAAATNEGASSPASRLARDRRQSNETCRLARFESAEFGHFDQEGEGGDGGDAGNAGQDGEAIGEACVGFDNLENCGFDCRHLSIDLFEPLSVVTLQQRERQDLSAVFGRGAVLHEGLRGDVQLPEFEQGLASGRTRLQLQHRSHASQHSRIQAIGLRKLAGGLGEAASDAD